MARNALQATVNLTISLALLPSDHEVGPKAAKTVVAKQVATHLVELQVLVEVGALHDGQLGCYLVCDYCLGKSG